MVYNIFYPNFPEYNITGGPPIAALRVGDWKYIHQTLGYAGWAEAPENNGKGEQVPSYDDIRNVLYNIAEEKENLYEAEPEVAAELEAKLEEYITALPDGFYPPKDPAGRPENFGAVWTAGWC